MAKSLAQLENDIRELSSAEQSSLLKVLVEQLDGADVADVDAAWSVEVARRDDEIESGAVAALPASDVFAEIESRLKK
jgi:hypothetical protein